MMQVSFARYIGLFCHMDLAHSGAVSNTELVAEEILYLLVLDLVETCEHAQRPALHQRLRDTESTQ